jgi:hypothetical protein
MKLKLKITGLTLVGEKVLVQMQSKLGHASLTVTESQASVLHIGQEATLEVSGTGFEETEIA